MRRSAASAMRVPHLCTTRRAKRQCLLAILSVLNRELRGKQHGLPAATVLIAMRHANAALWPLVSPASPA